MADDPIPTAVPWYKSKVLQGILVTLVLQILSRTKFASFFSSDDVTAIVGYIFDAISAGSLFYAAHARVTKPNPAVVSSQAKADAINTAMQNLEDRK